ncbi:MAG: hypothetical protein FJ399_02730 [Verrucomicrobia bacterium]|nr:hypothetical protein [Verrucomicrobiota bacterium]
MNTRPLLSPSTLRFALGCGVGALASSAVAYDLTPKLVTPRPTTSNLNAVAWSGSRYIAAGAGATVLLNERGDAAAWRAVDSKAFDNLQGAAYGSGKFVVVGLFGETITSSDGADWTRLNHGITTSCYAITFGTGGFVAVGEGGNVLTSSDGSTWRQRNAGVTAILRGVIFAQNRFWAVGDTGTIVRSSDLVTWEKLAVPTTDSLRGIAYGLSQYIAVGANGRIVQSKDGGATWTVKTSPTTDTLNCVGYASPGFVIGTNTGGVISSTDGEEFKDVVSPTSDPIYGINTANAQGLVMVGRSGSIVTAGFESGTVTPPTPTTGSRLVNLSIRTNAGTGSQTLIVGFVLGGSGSRQLLIRGIGPTLGSFGVTGALADSTVQLFSGETSVAANDNWGGTAAIREAAASVGAFALADTSRDAALLQTLSAGGYTAQIGGGTGVALVEVYEVGSATAPRLANVSARTQVGTGAEILISGFVIAGQSSKTVLLRAVGPGLAPFGVTGVLADPKLDVYSGSTLVQTNDNWGGTSALSTAFTQVGAFALPANSQDAVLLLTLQPGAYSAQVSGVNSGTGVALIEVYEMP